MIAAASPAWGAEEAAKPSLGLSKLFSDHMVLQSGQSAPVWGWAAPGTQLAVRFAGQSHQAKASADGKWRVTLDPLEVSTEPRALTVEADTTVTVNDVLVGEVWVCAGQSNMEKPVAFSEGGEEAIKRAASTPMRQRIREFRTPRALAVEPRQRIEGRGGGDWVVAGREDRPGRPYVARFSAVSYYFAESLQDGLDGVPVGLIRAQWSGTKIKAWIPRRAFESAPKLAMYVEQARENASNEHSLSKDSPTAIFNAKVAPLTPVAVRGVLWYQGEGNRNSHLHTGLYDTKLRTMIGGWREAWKRPELPFGIVQIAPFGGPRPSLCKLWQAQISVTQAVPHAGLAVTVDVGNPEDIHPRRKQPVGHRLALWARANVYGEQDLVWTGPRFESMQISGNKARITFTHVGDGLQARDEKALNFWKIAGEDKTFHDATATIKGNDTVVVHRESVGAPKAVRFGWQSNANPNLVNSEDLPALPFRTDDW